jgi:hypothetical protein
MKISHAPAWLLLSSTLACTSIDPAQGPVPGEDSAPTARRSPVLDGREKSLVIIGYSTSYAWPAMLQDMLDAHAGGERRYHVLNAVVGGAPVDHWVSEPGTANYQRTMGAMIGDFIGPDARLRGDAPEPTVAICQQSLQFTRSLRGPVTTGFDMVGAELGADEMEKMARQLHELGIEQVQIAMHIYKQPVEPEVGNERIALARLLTRGIDYISAGPDLWQITRDRFPECFTADELHPNELGSKLMAAAWYRSIAGPDTREDIVARAMERDYDDEALMRDYLAWRRDG